MGPVAQSCMYFTVLCCAVWCCAVLHCAAICWSTFSHFANTVPHSPATYCTVPCATLYCRIVHTATVGILSRSLPQTLLYMSCAAECSIPSLWGADLHCTVPRGCVLHKQSPMRRGREDGGTTGGDTVGVR